MGDRRNVRFVSKGQPDVYLYTHWGAPRMPGCVAAALAKGRWDGAYLAANVFRAMLKGGYDNPAAALDDSLSYGISGLPCGGARDSTDENGDIVVNLDKHTVTDHTGKHSFDTYMHLVQGADDE